MLGDIANKVKMALGSFAGVVQTTGEWVFSKITADEADIENARIKNLEVLERIQVSDRATGEIYCTWLENGEWVKVKGNCDTMDTNGTEDTWDITETVDCETRTTYGWRPYADEDAPLGSHNDGECKVFNTSCLPKGYVEVENCSTKAPSDDSSTSTLITATSTLSGDEIDGPTVETDEATTTPNFSEAISQTTSEDAEDPAHGTSTPPNTEDGPEDPTGSTSR